VHVQTGAKDVTTTIQCTGYFPDTPAIAFNYFSAIACADRFMSRVGQNRINTPYMTVYLVISLPKIPYIHRIYMVLANPIYELRP